MKDINLFKNNSVFKYIINKYISSYKLDHIAYRSFNKNKIIKKYINNNFIIQKDLYKFPKHNAHAIWLNNNNNIIPRIFVSEYNSIYFDDNFLNTNIDLDEINYYIHNDNKQISYKLYYDLFKINQYLAWTLVFRDNIINHLAIEVNNIKQLNTDLENDEIINLSGNLQISDDKNLLQFSTKSEYNLVNFSDGNYYIPTFFFEFVERLNSRDGFSEKNANMIFDSTK